MQKDPDPRDLRYLSYVECRLSKLPDTEIAQRLGFESDTILYRQLSQDGYPVCPECGAAPVTGEHCKPRKQERERRARQGGGEAVELPHAIEAEGLFLDALARLKRDIDQLRLREEHYRDGRFDAAYIHRSAGRSFYRDVDADTDEEWERLCRKYGEDPDQEWFHVFDHGLTLPEGALQYPAEPLTKLIAVYILADMPLEPLLETLHPAPEYTDTEQLQLHIEGRKTKKGHVRGLKGEAQVVARLVRGGEVKRGPSTGEVSQYEQGAAWYIQKRREEGATDAEIGQELRLGGFGREDVERLKGLKLPPPE